MALLGDVLSTIPAVELRYRADDMQDATYRHRFRRFSNLVKALRDVENLSSKSTIILRA